MKQIWSRLCSPILRLNSSLCDKDKISFCGVYYLPYKIFQKEELDGGLKGEYI